MSYFKDHQDDAAAVDYIWKHMKLRMQRDGIVYTWDWDDSLMQGQEGFGSSIRHGHICSRFLRKVSRAFPTLNVTQATRLTNIDDVVFNLFHRGNLNADEIRARGCPSGGI